MSSLSERLEAARREAQGKHTGEADPSDPKRPDGPRPRRRSS